MNDDFGDVYGIYYALTADEGFSYTDLRDWAQRIRTQLTPIEGVQKVMLYGEQTEVINVKISTSKLSALGIDPTSIMGILQKQNIQVNTGDIATEIYQLRLRTEGTYTSLEDIENQLIISKDGREVRLGDIATVERGYYDPPSTLMRVNGKRAIGIGVASGAKDNVVAVGKAVDERLAEIEQLLPIGIELASLYPEDKIADEANNGFILNLIESLVIVILIIFVVMGSRAGMLIGSSLLFSVGGTLLIMLMWGVGLNRTSLAAFIIAMGMLVDNAIVVTDNAQIGIKRGKSRYQSLIEGAIKPQWALLGATFIAICSFLPLYLAPAFVGVLFFVARIWDAINDPMMGMIVDNTHTRFGKFRIWLVIGTLVNSVVFVLLFHSFNLSGTALYVYVSVMYILYGMTYTIMDIPYWSVIPNLTSDPHEREVVSVLPRIFASIGQSLVIAGFGVQIIAALGGGYIGYHRFAMIIAGTFILTIGVAVCNLKVKENNAPSEKISFKDVFSIIKKNDQLQSAVGLILLYNVGIQFIMGVAVYYFTYVCGNANMLSAFMISASIAEVVGLIIFPEVAKKLSRHTSFLLACILPFIGLALLLVVGFVCPQNIVLTAVAGVIVKTGTGLELGCATVFLSDVVDYGEYKLGTRNESVVFSLQTLIVKFTAALTSLFIGFALERTGYIPNPNAVQSALTLNSIRFLMCAIPAVSMLVAYVVYKKAYHLDDSFMKKVIQTIEERRANRNAEQY